MQSVNLPLPEDPQELKQLLLQERARSAEQEAVIDDLKQRYQAMLEQFRLAQQRRFGTSSESADQLGLFNESLVPFNYLRYVLGKLPNQSEEIYDLLPRNSGLPQITKNL